MHSCADFKFHIDRDDVLQECVDVIVGECWAPFPAKIFPLIECIVQPAQFRDSSEAEEPLFADSP